MSNLLLLMFCIYSGSIAAKDLSVTWEALCRGINGQIKHTSKIRFELMQLGGEIKKTGNLYTEDTKPGDDPNVVYTVLGRLGKKQPPLF